jgi:hypothetical protein
LGLTGRWLGETEGTETLLHFWALVQKGNYLNIYTRWEGETHLEIFAALVKPENNSFTLETGHGKFEATLINSQRFIIPKWVWVQEGNKFIPKYDVVFYKRDGGTRELYYGVLLHVLLFIRGFLHMSGLCNFFKDPLLLIL